MTEASEVLVYIAYACALFGWLAFIVAQRPAIDTSGEKM